MDYKDLEDFGNALDGDRFKLSAISSSFHEDASENYDHFHEMPEIGKKSDERTK